MQLYKNNLISTSTVGENKKLHKKITEHIKAIIKNNSCLIQQATKNAEKIPEKIIMKSKQSHKYLYKKKLINNKFQWLNKYISNSQLQSLPINVEPNSQPKCQGQQNQQIQTQNLSKNRRAKTEAIMDSDQQGRLSFVNKQQKMSIERKTLFQHHLLKERSLNGRMLSEQNFLETKSKSIKNRKSVLVLNDQNLRPSLTREKKLGFSNNRHRNQSISNQSEDKENLKNSVPSSKKGLKIEVDQNTPNRQFQEESDRFNTSNLMIKNKSGYLKKKKKQHIFQSREQKRQQSQFLRIKRRFEEQITVEPWNLDGNEKDENQDTDFML